MKKIVTLSAFICLIALAFISCHCRRKSQTGAEVITDVKKDTINAGFKAKGYVQARVIFLQLDGCTYLLQLEDSTRLEPTNMSADFRKDKLDVWIKYTIDNEAVSICMAGQLVKLSDIQLRK